MHRLAFPRLLGATPLQVDLTLVETSTYRGTNTSNEHMDSFYRPWEAVKVVASAPACRAPWIAPAAPPSLCISTTLGMVPHRLACPLADHSSANSPILEDGVIG